MLPRFEAFILALAAVAVLALALALPARAQEEVDSTLVARYQLADSYLRSGQFDRAIGLLEQLYQNRPGTLVFYQKLKEAYESVKRYDDAVALVDERIRIDQVPSAFLAEKGRLLYLKGDEQGAIAAWEATIESGPENPGTYLISYRALMQLRLFERAIDVLEQGRQNLGNATLFQTDLAYLYSLTGGHADAMREYLGVLAVNERQLTFVRGRLDAYIDQSDARDASIAEAEIAVRASPLNRAYRELLAWLYLEAGRYREALDANRAIDRLEQEQGRVLFGFAQLAGDAGAYDVALDAYGEILERYPDAPTAPETRRARGVMYERWGDLARAASDSLDTRHYSDAMASYRAFLETHPGHELQADVLYRIGHIQQDVLFDPESASKTFKEILDRFASSTSAQRAAFDLGRIALEQDELEQARFRFARLADQLRTGELAESARFELAMIHFYRGEFEASLALTQSMKENTAADVSNDAIGLKVLLIENRGPDSLDTPLRGYARAQLLARQRRPAEALSVLEEMLNQLANHPLTDEAQFFRTRLLEQVDRIDDAVAALKEFPLIHPTSHLADRSLFRAAELEETRLGNIPDAIATYTRLLSDYPGSLLIAETRSRIRRLRGDGA